jgi:hypothetical protein
MNSLLSLPQELTNLRIRLDSDNQTHLKLVDYGMLSRLESIDISM